MNTISLTGQDLAELSSERRALLINSLPGYKPAMLVGTASAEGDTNLAIISSHFHLGSRPPLLAMILRPDTGNSERHTLRNILDTEHWTLNGFTLAQAAKAHHTSASFPKSVSEFDACGFCESWRPPFRAPFVESAPLAAGCLLREHKPLPINGTHLIIGEVVHLDFLEDAQRPDGALALDQMSLAAVSGLDTYTAPGAGVSYPPANVDSKPQPH